MSILAIQIMNSEPDLVEEYRYNLNKIYNGDTIASKEELGTEDELILKKDFSDVRLDKSLISVNDNIKLVTKRNIANVPLLMKIFYLYLNVNDCASKVEKRRYKPTKELYTFMENYHFELVLNKEVIVDIKAVNQKIYELEKRELEISFDELETKFIIFCYII